MIDFIKKHWLFSLIEIAILIADFINYMKNDKFLCMFLLALIIYIIYLPIKTSIEKHNRDRNIPEKLRFIIDFIHSVGYDNKKFTKQIMDTQHIIDSITKKYVIDGINCYTEKIYSGTVNSKISEGIDILTCGGSSVSSSDINIDTYYLKKSYVPTNFKIRYDNERTKVLKIMFGNVLSAKSKFKVKYIEKNWFGSMRNDHDAIVVAEHLLFNHVNKQIINLEFKTGKIKSIETYSYNIKTHELIMIGSELKTNKTKYHFEFNNYDISNNCIYFILYTYK